LTVFNACHYGLANGAGASCLLAFAKRHVLALTTKVSFISFDWSFHVEWHI